MLSKTSKHSGPGSLSMVCLALQLLRSIRAHVPEKQQDPALQPSASAAGRLGLQRGARISSYPFPSSLGALTVFHQRKLCAEQLTCVFYSFWVRQGGERNLLFLLGMWFSNACKFFSYVWFPLESLMALLFTAGYFPCQISPLKFWLKKY